MYLNKINPHHVTVYIQNVSWLEMKKAVDGWRKWEMFHDQYDRAYRSIGTHTQRYGERTCHMAYLLVHSFASWLYRVLSVLYILAISGTSGSSGFGSVSIEQIDSSTLLIVSAGDH